MAQGSLACTTPGHAVAAWCSLRLRIVPLVAAAGPPAMPSILYRRNTPPEARRCKTALLLTDTWLPPHRAQLVSVLCRNLVHQRRNHAAGAAPGSPKVNLAVAGAGRFGDKAGRACMHGCGDEACWRQQGTRLEGRPNLHRPLPFPGKRPLKCPQGLVASTVALHDCVAGTWSCVSIASGCRACARRPIAACTALLPPPSLRSATAGQAARLHLPQLLCAHQHGHGRFQHQVVPSAVRHGAGACSRARGGRRAAAQGVGGGLGGAVRTGHCAPFPLHWAGSGITLSSREHAERGGGTPERPPAPHTGLDTGVCVNAHSASC